MKKYNQELSVGLFVLAGLICLGYMTIKLGKMEFFGGDGYTLTARFASVAGLRTGASVEMSGVPVGRVSSIRLDPATFFAQVDLRIDEGVVLTDDSIASVKTSGLIGDKYISLSAGSGSPLADGGKLTETLPAFDLEKAIGEFIHGGVK